MPTLAVELLPALADNYIYLLFDSATGTSGVVDPGDARVVLDALARHERGLDWILLTHHHADHIGGCGELREKTGARVAGPRAETGRIPDMDSLLAEGDAFSFGSHTARISETPGHTSGHISYHFAEGGALFCGDTLFALGCGRLFEGTPAQMWASLAKYDGIPDDTRIYCGHEYTQSNARFAVTVDPENDALRERALAIDAARAAGEPTIPSTLGVERATNPFLRPGDPAIRRHLGMADRSDAEVFAEIRRRKDSF